MINKTLTELNVSRETFEKLSVYVDELIKWNEKINLISTDSAEDLWKRHVLDAVQLKVFFNKDQRIVDLGSGNGIPGVVLSALGFEVTLVEKSLKKTQFLRKIKSLLSLKLDIINSRVEELNLKRVKYVTCRGFDKIVNVINLTENLFYDEIIYVLPKGASYKDEIVEAQKKYLFEYKCFGSVTSSSSKIIVLNCNDKRNNSFS
ncbi:MAG: 16S rRNA (guanine(527)-N(7))-methyltransferase RsmG [Rickettsiales bacterium]